MVDLLYIKNIFYMYSINIAQAVVKAMHKIKNKRTTIDPNEKKDVCVVVNS